MWSERRLKRVASKLRYYPLLQRLLLEPWLRVGVGLVLLAFLLVPLVIVKWWTVSPIDFLPKVKVSILDLLQAGALERGALKAMLAGDYAKATLSWQSAVANNPADPSLLRGSLTNYLNLSRPAPRDHQWALSYGVWLLRLTKTNRDDAMLAGQVFSVGQQYQLAEDVLSQIEPPLALAAEVELLKVLFLRGELKKFVDRYEDFRQRYPQNEDIELYHAAWQMGWGPLATVSDGKRRLETAMADPKHEITARRLHLQVSYHLRRAEDYRASLDWFVDRQIDTLHDHLFYWNLLVNLGQMDQVKRLAENWTRRPESPAETIELCRLGYRLQLKELTEQTIRLLMTEYPGYPQAWLAVAEYYLAEKRWNELPAIVSQIRLQPMLHPYLDGYCEFLEGRAAFGLGQFDLARLSFQKAAIREYDEVVGIGIAESLFNLGYPQEARTILAGLEEKTKDHLAYWQLLFKAAVVTKQEDLANKAAMNAYRLSPNDFWVALNYAASLIVQPGRLAEAVQMTFELLEKHPDSVEARLNHALALAKLHRESDAESIIAKIISDKLPVDYRNVYYQVQFYIYAQRDQKRQARRVLDQLQLKELLPSEQAVIGRLALKLQDS